MASIRRYRTVPSTMNQYIAFSIDPFKTLKYLDDPEVDTVTREMQTKTYAGKTESLLSGLIAAGEYDSWSVQFVHPGLPEPSGTRGIAPSMCTPIDPTTYHPSARRPVRPTSPLPWPYCYHHTFSSVVSIRTSVEAQDATPPIRLPGRESNRLDTYRREDSRRREKQVQANRLAQPSHPSAALGAQYASFDTANDCSQRLRDAEYEDDVQSELDETYDEPQEITAVVNATYDLSTIDAPAEPADFLKEKAFLEQLARESRARAIERARRTNDEGSVNDLKNSTARPPWLSPRRAWSRLRLHFDAVLSTLRAHIPGHRPQVDSGRHETRRRR